MIRLFSKNDIGCVISLLIYTLLIRVHLLVYPTFYQPNIGDSLLSNTIFSSVSGWPILCYLCSSLLVFLQAVHINVIANNSKIYSSQSGFAGLIYILIVSAAPEYLNFSPSIIGASFFLMALQSVFSVYKKSKATGYIVNASFFAAIATSFYFPYLFMFIAFFIALIILRQFSLKEQLQYVISYMAIFWISASILYYLGLLSFDYWNIFEVGGSVQIFAFHHYESGFVLIVLFLLILYALLNYYSFQKKKEIEARKKIDFLYWIMMMSLIAIFLLKDVSGYHLPLLGVPLSMLLSISVNKNKNATSTELLHIVFLTMVLFMQYDHLIVADI